MPRRVSFKAIPLGGRNGFKKRVGKYTVSSRSGNMFKMVKRLDRQQRARSTKKISRFIYNRFPLYQSRRRIYGKERLD